jgi:hypothetical protein
MLKKNFDEKLAKMDSPIQHKTLEEFTDAIQRESFLSFTNYAHDSLHNNR